MLTTINAFSKEQDTSDVIPNAFRSKIFVRHHLVSMQNDLGCEKNTSYVPHHSSLSSSFDEKKSSSHLKTYSIHPHSIILFARTTNALIDFLNTLMCREYFRKIRLPCSLVHPYFFPDHPIVADDLNPLLENIDLRSKTLYIEETPHFLPKE